MKKTWALTFSLSALYTLPLYAADYYVDSNASDMSGTGASAASPFKSLSQLPLQGLTGDTSIYLRCGSVWYNTISIANTVMNTSNLTITSYGSNCDGSNRPIIDGAMPLTGWTVDSTDTSGTVFKSSTSVSVMTTQLLDAATDRRLPVARFPNPDDPQGAMRLITADSVDINTLQTSEHYLIDKDADAPFWAANPQLDPTGAEIHIRNRNWRLQDRIVTYFDRETGELGWFENDTQNSNLAIKQSTVNSKCPGGCIAAGYGYYLANLRWMMDQPGEWYQDRSTGSVYIKTADGVAPADGSIVASVRGHGIEIALQANVTISDIEIRNVRDEAVYLNKVYNYQIVGMDIRSPGASGIWVLSKRPDPVFPINNYISNNTVENASTAGILVKNGDGQNKDVEDGWVTEIKGNVISNIGNWDYADPDIQNLLKEDRWLNDPSQGRGIGMQLSGDKHYNVIDNHISSTGYSGVQIAGKTLKPMVTGNRITDFTLMLDDGAGIYIGGTCYTPHDLDSSNPDSRTCASEFNENAVISQNIVGRGIGNLYGRPGSGSATHGIYLDSDTVNSSVTNNIVYEVAGSGVFVHDASDNFIDNNILFANEQAVEMIENTESNVTKSVSNIEFSGNTIVHLADSEAVKLRSQYDTYAELADTATFSNNRYYSPLTYSLVDERYVDGSVQSSLAQWQSQRGQDAASTQLFGYQLASSIVEPASGGNLIGNSTFESDLSGWGCWFPGKTNGCPLSSTDPYRVWTPDCAIGDGGCMTLAASATETITATYSHLDIAKGNGYLLEFAAQGGAADQAGRVIVRKTNQNGEGWDSLGVSESITVGTEPQYFHYAFTGLEDYSGGAAYFYADAFNSLLNIDNFVLMPVSLYPVDLNTAAVLLVNTTDAAISYAQALTSGQLDPGMSYISMDGTPASATGTLEPGKSLILIAANDPHRDLDGDGVAEGATEPAYHDRCINTVPGAPTNRYGCSFAQRDDWDGDGVLNTDEDILGTSREKPDTDGDGYNDGVDAFPTDPNEWVDSDADGVGDNSDNCPNTPNADQADSNGILDGDGVGDACEPLSAPTIDSSNVSVAGDTATISGTASDADGNLAVVEVNVNNNGWQAATGTTSWLMTLSSLSDGNYSYQVRARDSVGLQSATSDVHSFSVQTCFSTTNQEHEASGRAYVGAWGWYRAEGSDTWLGGASWVTSLREASPGVWEKQSSCN